MAISMVMHGMSPTSTMRTSTMQRECPYRQNNWSFAVPSILGTVCCCECAMAWQHVYHSVAYAPLVRVPIKKML